MNVPNTGTLFLTTLLAIHSQLNDYEPLGLNIFCYGPAGTGKTETINRTRDACVKNTFLLNSIAASDKSSATVVNKYCYSVTYDPDAGPILTRDINTLSETNSAYVKGLLSRMSDGIFGYHCFYLDDQERAPYNRKSRVHLNSCLGPFITNSNYPLATNEARSRQIMCPVTDVSNIRTLRAGDELCKGFEVYEADGESDLLLLSG
jgi:hypothetical protein